jgi:transposase
MEWAPVYHIKGWGEFNRNYGDFCTGADTVVAVARKLAVLLHRLWVSGEVYEPLRNSQKAMRAAA